MSELRNAEWPCAALYDADLGSRTTLRVGGTAEWLLEPSDPEELVSAWKAARELGVTPRVLGWGANLLVADGQLPGVVIATDRLNRSFRPMPDARTVEEAFQPQPSGAVAFDRESDPRLVAWVGAGLPALVRQASKLGWRGLEGLSGVPGNLGGGIAMNAGGKWGELWDVVQRVRLMTPDGEVVERTRAECSPSYRNGGLEGAVCLGAVLALEVATVREVTERTKEFLREKNAVQPVTERSSNYIFKNPNPKQNNNKSTKLLIQKYNNKN